MRRFYYDWYDEVKASPLTEKEYLSLAYEILSEVRAEIEKCELEDMGIKVAVCSDCPFEGRFSDEDCRACQRLLNASAQAMKEKILKRVK